MNQAGATKKGFSAYTEKVTQFFSDMMNKGKHLVTNTYEHLPKPLQKTWDIAKNTISFYDAHDTSTLGAGLSYYMIFSIAPMLIIVISVVGSIYGPDAVNGALKQQIQGLLGSSTADELQKMVKTAYQPGKNWIATSLSVILLVSGAVGVFDQLRTSLNVIWDVEEQKKKAFFRYLMTRLFSMGMIICLAFLLLVSLSLSALVTAFSGYLSQLIPEFSKVLAFIIELVLSFSITTLLFAFIYKFMGDIKLAWKVVIPGAVFTTLLFELGKYLIGLYISSSNLANTYGAASSVVVVLLWVFYSSQIVFFGAEFTRALAVERGIPFKNSQYTKEADAKLLGKG